jgi:hypothetical protein
VSEQLHVIRRELMDLRAKLIAHSASQYSHDMCRLMLKLTDVLIEKSEEAANR